jgi:hypothetical protein
MLAVPPATPLTTPVPELTVATPVLLLVQETRVGVLLLNVVVVPAHNVMVPVVAPGVVLTVYIAVV